MDTSRQRPRLALATIVASDLVALVVLHAVGRASWFHVDWQHPLRWLSVTPTEDALAALLRHIALGAGYWLLASTVVYVLCRSLRWGDLAAVVAGVTLPAARRLADRALVVAATTSIVSAAGMPVALATAPPSETTPDPDVVRLEHGRLVPPGVAPIPEPIPAPTRASVPGLAPDPSPRRSPGRTMQPPSGETAAPDRHVVVNGDNLWRIASTHLSAGRTPPISDADVAAYWRRVVAANRERLRSGDPDLIYPGERIDLPGSAT